MKKDSHFILKTTRIHGLGEFMEINPDEEQVMEEVEEVEEEEAEEAEEETKRCTNCSRGPQPMSVFTKDGKVLNRCLKCREKDSRRSKRPDVRERKYAANKIAKPWVTYRERQRENNERGFLDHNNEVAQQWRDENREHVREWSRNSLHKNWDANMRSARKKNIAMELSEDEYKNLMQQSCTYCGFLDEKKKFGGVDRMDSSKGYTKENAVSCCKKCNFMKTCLDPVTFINRARHIANVVQNPNAWPKTKKTSYVKHKESAKNRKISCDLTTDEHEMLVVSQCHYCCRLDSAGGVDRKDSQIGYRVDNCVPCCAECNYFKKTMNPEQLMDQCTRIATFWSDSVQSYHDKFGHVPRNLRSVTKRTTFPDWYV